MTSLMASLSLYYLTDLFSGVGGLKLDDAITHAIKETQLNIVDSLLEFAYKRGFIRHEKKKST